MDNAEAPYLLARHVHLCVCGRYAVLMDLRRDKYLAVEPANLLAGRVTGWPTAGRREDPRTSPQPGDAGPVSARADRGEARARSVLSRMLAQGMLVCDERRGRPAAPLLVAPAQRTLLEFDFDERAAAGAARLGRFALAFMRARASLALRPMREIIRSVQARKARMCCGACAPDAPRERSLVMSFVHLRPLFYTVRRACLLDSLTLLHFLAAYGVYPEWVFGVRTAPFDAHCWVQRGELLFNDHPDRVSQYSPILLV